MSSELRVKNVELRDEELEVRFENRKCRIKEVGLKHILLILTLLVCNPLCLDTKADGIQQRRSDV